MLRWLKLSLRYRFILTLVAFTVVLSVSFGYIAAERLRHEMEQQVLQRGYQVSKNIVQTIKFTDEQGLPIPLQSALNFYQGLFQIDVGGDLLYIQVVANGQQAILPSPEVGPDLRKYLDLQAMDMKYTTELDRLRLPSGIPQPYLASTPYYDLRIAISTASNQLIWEFGQTPRIQRVPPAYVRVGLSLTYVDQVVQREWLQFAGLSALYTIIGLLLAFLLYKSILGPIDALTKAVKRFKREKDVRAQVRSRDELQTLAEEFNRMADTIVERDTRLERINEELRRSNRVKSEFLAVMGHELKTPLHAIRGNAQLLLEGVDGPVTSSQQEDLTSILASSDHLHELIDNILRFSKIESGAEQLHLDQVEAGQVIAEAVQSVKSLSREKGIEIETTANGLHRLRADGTKLKQILINLLGNAIKFSPGGGKVSINAEQEGNGVRFAVRDTGLGIPPEYKEKIFEPFTQIDSSTTREGTGIGLGLAIVKKYVEMHDGRVWVESELGHGSSFIFILPHSLLTPAAAEEVAVFEGADR
jgi:signal transduction histidine kinase